MARQILFPLDHQGSPPVRTLKRSYKVSKKNGVREGLLHPSKVRNFLLFQLRPPRLKLFIRLLDAEALKRCQAISDAMSSQILVTVCVSPLQNKPCSSETHFEIILVLNNRNASLGNIQQSALLIGNLDNW